MRRQTPAGWFLHDIKNRGITAWIASGLLIGFYLLLYFTEYLTPVAKGIGLPNKWTLYGLLYTFAITAGGVYMWRKYGHNRYQVFRISVIVAVQISFAFSIP
ncbi:MAG: FeS-binding protein, partial [Myxococcota bacterium]